MNGHRLLIPSLLQAEHYLHRRGEDIHTPQRDDILLDRAAAFWLCVQARQVGGPKTHWALLPGRDAPLPRLHMVPCGGIGTPIHRHPGLLHTLRFASKCLEIHGALWIEWPLSSQGVDKTFGKGAWKRAEQEEAKEWAERMDNLFEQPIPCMARRRL